MNSALAIALMVVTKLIEYAPRVVQTLNDLRPFATAVFTEIKGSGPTEQEQADLDAQIDVLYERAIKPLPPPQPGDPDYVKDK